MPSNIHYSQNPHELFENDKIKQFNSMSVKDIMDNCLDTIYEFVKQEYPAVFRPALLFSDSEEVNAEAHYGRKTILIHWGLIAQSARLIESRYTDDVIERYGLLSGLSRKTIHSGIRVYLWRFIVLHELYHLWHGHAAWHQKYKYDNAGVITKKSALSELEVHSESAKSTAASNILSDEEKQYRLTQQAFEHDADSCAVSMLIHLLLRDCHFRKLEGEARFDYLSKETALMMGALTTAFCLFDGAAGAKFEKLNGLEYRTHPLPSIRMVNAEEIADGCLADYIADYETRSELENEWNKIVCDVQADHDGEVDMGYVFYYTAYTEKAQRHISKLKERIVEVQETLKPFIVSNNCEMLEPEDYEFDPAYVWFDETGVSLRGWINPATGKPSAIMAKKPIVKANKVGPNDPCPCGSGKKYKRCCRRKDIES